METIFFSNAVNTETSLLQMFQLQQKPAKGILVTTLFVLTL